MNEITPEIVAEFKDRIHLSDDEDENIARILRASAVDLTAKCGNHDISTDERFKELVFERSRYVYNDALEYFDNNFLNQILAINLDNALSLSVEGDTGAG